MDELPFGFSGGLRPRPARIDKSSIERTEFFVLPLDSGRTGDGHFGLGHGHTWIPALVPDIHKRFARLKEEDVREVAGFARAYGFLVCDWERNRDPWEPIDMWRWHVQRVRFAINLITQFRRLNALKKSQDEVYGKLVQLVMQLPSGRVPDCLATVGRSRYCGWQADFLQKLCGGTSEHAISPGYNIEQDGFDRASFTSEMDASVGIGHLRMVLDRITTDPLAETTIVITESENGKAVLEPSCLLGAIYLGLFRQATSGTLRIEKTCRRCGKRFFPDQGNDHYCPDLDCEPGRTYDEKRALQKAFEKGGDLGDN
jgi:hypothetical protein